MSAEQERIGRQRHEAATADIFREKAKETQLSNDDIMKLLEDRVSAHSNVFDDKFWQTMSPESGY